VIYFDTTFLAKTYLNESGSGEVREFLRDSGEVVASSSLARAELVAVFHRHLREGHLSESNYQLVLKQYELDLRTQLWEWLPVKEDLWTMIEESFASLPETVFLRGADAMHLLTAKSHEFPEVFTNDRHMLKACGALGLKGRNLLQE